MNDTASVVCSRITRARTLSEISRVFELFLFPQELFLTPPVKEESKLESYGEDGSKVLAPGSLMAVVYGDGEDAGRYEVREASDLIPSHDVTNGFAKLDAYPEKVQERPYHSDSGEQEKVRRNALRLDPRFLITDNPDAINGPPIVTSSGIVLGGNSRTMSILQAYSDMPESAQRYREALEERAAVFGFSKETVKKFKAPVLVRTAKANMSTEDMARRARLYNQSLTQGLQTKAEGVSKGRLVSTHSLNVLSAALEDFDSIREYLDSPRSRTLVEALFADGVIEQTQLSRLTRKGGLILNEDGKRLVEHVLRGVAIDDYDVLEQLPPAIAAKLDRILTPLAKIKSKGGDWDISGKLKTALRQYVKFTTSTAETPDVFWNEVSLFDAENAIRADRQVRALFFLMAKGKPKEVESAWKLYAATAGMSVKGQATLPGVSLPTPDSTFKKSFAAVMESSTGDVTWADFLQFTHAEAITLACSYSHQPLAVFEACFAGCEGDAIYESKQWDEEDIFESALPTPPASVAENIRRGTEAMKRVIATHTDENRVMYREKVGWISFRWGFPGTPPKSHKNNESMLEWWKSLSSKEKNKLFGDGWGVSHIITKRDWEGKYIKEFLGQRGDELALKLVDAIARGRYKREPPKTILELAGYMVILEIDPKKSNLKSKNFEDKEHWVVSGYKIKQEDYKLVFESADASVGVKPFCSTHTGSTCEAGTSAGASREGEQTALIFLSGATHSKPTVYRQGVGATDSVTENIQHPLTDGKGLFTESSMNDVFESAQIRTPNSVQENIARGTEAMKRVIARHVDEPKAMFRDKLGWISFPWGKPGTPPPSFKTDEEMLAWWHGLSDKFALFTGGYGVSHVIAKRDWEGKWIKPLLGQKGGEVAISLVEVIARGKPVKRGQKYHITFAPWQLEVVLLRQTKPRDEGGEEEYWLLSGMKTVAAHHYSLIFESADVPSGGSNPLRPTHSLPTFARQGVGAADSVTENIQHPLTDGKGLFTESSMNMVFERASREPVDPIAMAGIASEVRATTTFDQLASIFRRLFKVSLPVPPDAYTSETSDYGLKVKGKKAREKLNAQCREILNRVSSPENLTSEDRAVLLQYSGRGGLTENSQYEYYTPPHVAEGVWDALKANGFENGNVLDPCVGAGIFSGTKPGGVVITGNDLDPVGSGVAALLNPSDHIATQSFERVAVNTPGDTFDSCVGNVPFGNARGASLHEDPAYKNEKLIERYFLQRIIDKLKPGGLACLVVPANIISAKGKRWEEWRTLISRKAEFLGAHKLPSKTFSAQGTNTVVDVLVLRKHSRELAETVENLGIDALHEAHVVWPEFVEGRYWQGEGRQFIMGRYVPKVDGDRWSRDIVDGDLDNEAMKRKLAQKFHSRIDWETLHLAEPVLRTYSEGDRRSISGTMYVFQSGSWQKESEQLTTTALEESRFGAKSVEELRSLLSSPKGSLSLNNENMFAVYKSFPEMLSEGQKGAVEFALSQPKEALREQLYRGSILGGMLARMASKAESGEDVTEDRTELQALITAEIERFGHPRNNKGLLLAGDSSRMFGMFQNTIDEQGNFSDLLAGTLDKSVGVTFNPADATDIVTHLFVRQGQEDIHLEDVQALYSGEALTLADLAERENLAITPDGRIMPLNRYCAGDVFPKIAACAEAIAATDDERLKAKFRSQIDAINQRRTVTTSESIVFGLRQKWLSRKYVVDFLRENGFPQVEYGTVRAHDKEQYDGTVETVTGFAADYDNPEGAFRGLPDSGFYKQFEKYLNGGKVTSSREEIKAEYTEKVDSLERQFNVWMQQHPDIVDITEQFNRQFNGYVPFEYEGEPLGIDEYISGEIMPHSYQNAEVRRLSEQGSGICGFGVGLGKSFTALATVAYNHKKGRAKRTCLVVPSAVLENWYHEARQFYNEAYFRSGVQFVGIEVKKDKDGVVQRREILDEKGKPRLGKDGSTVMQDIVVFRNAKEDIFEDLWKIPQSNCNLVVMSKEKFKSIPMRPSTMRGYTDEMVSRSLMSEKLAEKVNDGKRSYSDDKAIANIEARYSEQGTKKKDELPYLEDMGFDAIITDESHFFKNSFEAGKESQGIAYLPTAPASQIAIDMAIKSHYIRKMNNGRGVYGLTATPVTNSPFEIFNMLSLVAPIEEFERFGVRTVDDFVRVFGRIESVDKMTVAGEAKTVNGLVGFQNLDGLRNLFHKYVTVKTVKDVDNEIHVPDAEEIEENVTISEEQASLYESLRVRAKKAATPSKESESIFSIIRDMDRLTTDIDMFNRTMTFVFQKKHRAAVEKLIPMLPTEWTVEDVDEDTGGKFSRNIPVNAELKDFGDTLRLVVPDTMEDVVLMHFAELGIVESEVAHPITPKYAKLMENLKKHFECGGKQIVFTEEKTQHQKIRRIIVHHLPVTTEQIGIINAEDAKGDKLDQIAKAYNSGTFKIVIANKKAEVGVNLQKGTTAIHHLTLPWTPASINQRNGRGVRQGNSVDSVALYYYCGKGTFDSYRKDLLKAKSNWINDLLMGQSATMDNGDVTGMDELLDMLADDPEQAKRQRAERLAAVVAKKEEAARLTLVNKLQVLASIQNTLDGLDAKKQERRTVLQGQLDAVDRTLARLEATSRGVVSEADKQDFSQKITAAKRRKADIETGLVQLDAKFDDQRAKQEANRKMTVGTLRQAEREGRLPFDVSLIDRPTDVLVSTKGDLFCVGDMIEIQKGGEIWKITEIKQDSRSLVLEHLLSEASPKTIPVNNIPAFVKVSYSETELALKKLLRRSWSYAELRKSGIDRETFLAHLPELNIETGIGGVFRHEGKLVLCSDGYSIPEGAVLAWPEPENEDWRKTVCIQYLKIKKRGSWIARDLMTGLFGSDFVRIAESYGRTGTEAEILKLLSESWNALKQEREVQTVQEEETLLSSTLCNSVFTKTAYEQYDNASDIRRLAQDYIHGLLEDAFKRATEEREEKQRIADESLKKNPNYKEIPKASVEAFAQIGITVRVNLKEASLPGFKGRKGTTYAPFSRWWLQDKNGKMGTLYKMKEILKNRYSAQFSSEWNEHSGAWWHVPSTVKLEELHDLLA